MSFGLPDVLQHRKALLSITRDRGASSRQHLHSASLRACSAHLLDMGNQCGASSPWRTREKRRLRGILHTRLGELCEVPAARTRSDDEFEGADVKVTEYSSSTRLQERHTRPRRNPYDLRLREVPALEDGGERGTTLAVCFVARESPLRDGWPHPRAAGAELRIKHLPRP